MSDPLTPPPLTVEQAVARLPDGDELEIAILNDDGSVVASVLIPRVLLLADLNRWPVVTSGPTFLAAGYGLAYLVRGPLLDEHHNIHRGLDGKPVLRATFIFCRTEPRPEEPSA